jgi:uncharacterized protein with HEPN domain
MWDAASAIAAFVEGKRYDEFASNRMLRNAVERNLEVLGEAARGVSEATRARAPRIPWRALVGLRNVLAHEYGDIRYERLWAICTESLPRLVEELKALGADAPEASEGRDIQEP